MHKVYEISNRSGVSVKWDSNIGRWVVVLSNGDRIFTDIVACGDTIVIDGTEMSVMRSSTKVEPEQVPGLCSVPKPVYEPGRKEMVD